MLFCLLPNVMALLYRYDIKISQGSTADILFRPKRPCPGCMQSHHRYSSTRIYCKAPLIFLTGTVQYRLDIIVKICMWRRMGKNSGKNSRNGIYPFFFLCISSSFANLFFPMKGAWILKHKYPSVRGCNRSTLVFPLSILWSQGKKLR